MQTAEVGSTDAALPPQYVPYSVVDLCTNKLINVPVWFRVLNVVPLLIGRGEQGPRIWLKAPGFKPGEWRDIIVENNVVAPAVPPIGAVSLIHDIRGGDLQVGVGGFTLIMCKETGADELTVSQIDLSLLQLSIRGNLESGLLLGRAAVMKGNTFNNVQTAFGAG